jgi:uncharacterized protein
LVYKDSITRIFDRAPGDISMSASQTMIPTPSAARYLAQLCNHWKHKFAVEQSPDTGMIPFAEDRSCTLQATPDGLSLRVEAPDTEALAPLEGVVIDHLKRFAFREELGDVRWTPVVNA